MPAYNFPANPVVGDLITNPDMGMTYRFEAPGFWRAIKYDVVDLNPDYFCLRQVGPAANDQQVLLELNIPVGYVLDTTDFTAVVTSNPATDQVFDILVNNIRGADNITVAANGAITVNDDRGPYIGPVQLSVQMNTATVIDPAFGTLLFASPVEAI
jgi:hypothetical protein